MFKRAFISQSLTKRGILYSGVTIIMDIMLLGKVLLLVIMCSLLVLCLLVSTKKINKANIELAYGKGKIITLTMIR